MTFHVYSGPRKVAMDQVSLNGAKTAAGLQALGVGDGDSFATFMRNDIAMLETKIAGNLAGAYAVPVNWHATAEEAGYMFTDSGAKVIIIHADLLPGVASHLPPGVPVVVCATPPEIGGAYGALPELCEVPDGMVDYEVWRDGFEPLTGQPPLERGSMIYTSGTTGNPKGVRREPTSADRQARIVELALRSFGIRPGGTVAMTGPMYHSAPGAYASIAMALGNDIHLLPRFDPEGLLQAIDEHKISHMHVVPTMFMRMLRLPEAVKAKYDLSSLVHVIHGAAPCPPEAKKRMIEWWGDVIFEYYGSTEAGIVTVVNSVDWMTKPGTVGRPLDGTTVRIYDDDANILSTGESGEIYMTMNDLSDFTYHNKDDKRAEIERDGMVTNGDVGYVDEDGYVFLNDRKRDMIISGGVNIYPAEIEAALQDMPGVQDCAVFGIPHEDFGESIAAAIEPQPGASLTPEGVKEYLKLHISAYKVPREVTFHDAMPREDTGKIFKRKLRQPYWDEAGRQI
ncbi:MAG: AMP-binding protein [Rhodospirillaceae bacterium]|jgi:long-chain acyl-CoA synthetase|nr:AMP-binding protein [Rhodospirillaceae bacterium]MBT5192952.1 AMP-binding protein [Rhodospirillaceae bacterium]MBT5897065.1 AMP-binding protein [Rhodospirillaceae bacterium]MBT6426594.1 AMP-binding protein [Rhodospirillaceae bacterium]MBT7758350.1 AMP-binding protein [Rhodospirillaceae bacterium]